MSNTTVPMCHSDSSSLPLYHIVPRYLLTSIGVFSNIFLLTGMIMNPLKYFRNPSSNLIMNLGVADILTCCSSFVLLYWRPCAIRYETYPFFNLPPYISATSIFTMACDRYTSCVHPFKYRLLITGKVSLSVILLQLLVCTGHMIFEMSLVNLAIYIRGIVALCMWLCAAILYSRAAYVLKSNSRYLKGATGISTSTAPCRTQSARLVNEKRLLTTMLLVSFITIATLAPITIYESLTGKTEYLANEHSGVSERDAYHIWLRTLFLVNFSINPLMYA